MSDSAADTYLSRRKPRSEFATRDEYLIHELESMEPKKWGLNLPWRDYHFEMEDWVTATAATIGKITMVAAVVAAFAMPLGLSADFVIENTRFELLIAALLFCIPFSGMFNARANLPGTHGPMIPLIGLIVASGGHPLAMGILMGVFGLALGLSKGGSKLMNLTGPGVRGGLLIYLGAVGLLGQVQALMSWAEGIGLSYIAIVVLMASLVVYAWLAKVEKRWLAIPLCSLIALVLALALGAPFEFKTEVGLPHLSPTYWWGEDTGWMLGLPDVNHFIAVLPFAALAVAMWAPDVVGHLSFQQIHYPKKAEKCLMDADSTMTVASIRQVVGSALGGMNITSSWGTFLIPSAIAKRPIPAGAILTGVLCTLAAIWGAPMDLAVWPPVLRVALIVAVFCPLLEAGMHLVKDNKDTQSAGIVLFSSAIVNPVFGWAITMLMDNMGFIGNSERAQSLNRKDRLLIPGATFVLLGTIMLTVGMIPGVPALVESFR